jgi:hypothetical protein
VEREILGGLVPGQDLLRSPAVAQRIEIRVYAPLPTAILLTTLASGILDEDAAHGGADSIFEQSQRAWGVGTFLESW